MKRLVRYGLLLLVVFFTIAIFISLDSRVALANQEEEAEIEHNYTPEEKAAAIKAANDAILLIPSSEFIISAEQYDVIENVLRARYLVEVARQSYGASESDFSGMRKLIEAEAKVYKLLAIQAARDAIDAIPKGKEGSEEYRSAVEHARYLVDIAMEEYGATYFDICWRYDALEEAERRVDEEPEPEPVPVEPRPRPTPPTGGFSVAIALGLIISGTGVLLARHRQKERS